MKKYNKYRAFSAVLTYMGRNAVIKYHSTPNSWNAYPMHIIKQIHQTNRNLSQSQQF